MSDIQYKINFLWYNFCCKIKQCLSIDSVNGSESLFLTQQGTWASPPDLSSATFKTNGVDNGSQLILNLVEGTGVGLIDNGVGSITISSDLTFAQLGGKPTTLGGYGITDAVSDTLTINGYALSSNISITKSDVGLSNVDNTSDINKPTSSATQTALNLLVPKTTTVNGHALSGNISVTTTDLSLQNVNNTSDANKPISTATQSALNLLVPQTTTINGQALSSNVSITSSTLGLVSGSYNTTAIALQVNFIVTHGAGFTPSQVFITPTNIGSAAAFYVSAKGATTFTVTFVAAPGVVAVAFDWLVKQ